MTDAPEVKRKDVVGGSVTAEEKAVIEEARTKAGYKKMSHFIREVMLERSHLILGTRSGEERRKVERRVA